jgi:hypothetical protein
MRALACVSLTLLFAISDALALAHAGHPEKGAEPPFGGKQISGELTATSAKDKARPNRYCDVHEVKLKAGQTYQIDLASRDFDAYLRLEDSAGRQLAEDDDSGGGFNARLVFTPATSATYRVIATTFLPGATGPYTLRIGRVGQANTIYGKLTGEDPFDRVRAGRHSRTHPFTLTGKKTYQIDLISQDFDAYLRLEDSAGRQLAEDDDSGGGLNARLVFTPEVSGTYRVIATTFRPGETGDYVLKVRELPPQERAP